MSDLLTPEQVAERLQISKRKVLDMMSNDELPYIDLGYRTKRVKAEDLNAFIEAREVTSAAS